MKKADKKVTANQNLGLTIVGDQLPTVMDVIEAARKELAALNEISDRPYKTEGKLPGFPSNITEETSISNLVQAWAMIRGKQEAYNAAQEYSKADSIFGLMKTAYNRKELPEDDMKFRDIAIDESEWNGQLLTVYRYLVDPKESLDISYKVYLLSKTGKKVERTFMVEKTSQNPDHIKHLLCEKDKKTATHMTYSYGWTTDDIPLADLKKAVMMVLDGKMTPAASSNFGNK